MIIVKKKDFIDWIKEQRDDRKLSMELCRKVTNTKPCGCLMIQYAEDVLGFNKEIHCSDDTWREVSDGHFNSFKFLAKFEEFVNLFNIIEGGYHNGSETFGEIKKDLYE